MVSAKTSDFSDNGFSLNVQGTPLSLRTGDLIDLNIEDQPIKAKIVWVNSSVNGMDIDPLS